MACPLFSFYISVAPKLGLYIVAAGLFQKGLIPTVLLIEPPKAVPYGCFLASSSAKRNASSFGRRMMFRRGTQSG